MPERYTHCSNVKEQFYWSTKVTDGAVCYITSCGEVTKNQTRRGHRDNYAVSFRFFFTLSKKYEPYRTWLRNWTWKKKRIQVKLTGQALLLFEDSRACYQRY